MILWWTLAVAAFAAEPNPDQPAATLRHYIQKRVPVGSRTLPVERYVTAREQMKKMPLYSSRMRRTVPDKGRQRAASLGQWTSLGPGNIGGRTRALLVHPGNPDLMYAGGVAGGVWRTENGGASWTPLNDLLPNLAVNTMAMDPSDPRVLYVGTGEGFNNFDAVRGAGIFKSVDGGDTWEWLAATRTSDFYYVNKLLISRRDPQRIYAATTTGVFRSLDGGQTWQRTLDRRAPGLGCQDLALRTDQEDDVLFAACRATPQGAIWRNGQAQGDGKWEEVFTVPYMRRTSLAIAPSNQDVIYALAESDDPGACPSPPGPNPPAGCFRRGLLGLYRSTEGGAAKTWEVRAQPGQENKINATLLSNPRAYFTDVCSGGNKSFSNQGWYDNVVAVDPLNHDIVWAGGIDLFRSEDGGANFGIASYWWQRGNTYSHADHHGIVFHPGYDGGGNQTLWVTNDGGIFRTDNARAEVATGDRAACLATNSKINFRALNNGYGVTQFHHGSVYPGGHAYVGGTQDNGTVLGNDVNGADRWASVAGGDGGYTMVDPRDPRLLYYTNTQLTLRRLGPGNGSRTATFGITEPSANFSFITPYAMDPADSNRLWIGGRTLWRTTDGALNWQAASSALLTTTSFSAVAVSPVDPNRVLAGSSDGRIFRNWEALTANRDTVWENTRPRNGNVAWIAFDPRRAEVAYAVYSSFNANATDRHIYRTEDGGVTWKAIDGEGDTRLPDIPVHTILADPKNPSVLYAGTDLGVFVSVDDGANWAKEDSGFPNTVVEVMSIEAQGGGSQLYAFTHGRGAWKVWLGPGEPCRYELNTGRLAVTAAGGTFPIEVKTQPGCPWSALSETNFVIFEAAPVGNGTATLRLNVPASNNRREGRLLIAGQELIVAQN